MKIQLIVQLAAGVVKIKFTQISSIVMLLYNVPIIDINKNQDPIVLDS